MFLGNMRDGNGLLVDIQADKECARLRHGCLRAFAVVWQHQAALALVSSPAYPRGATYRHWKSLCLGMCLSKGGQHLTVSPVAFNNVSWVLGGGGNMACRRQQSSRWGFNISAVS